MTDVRGRAHDFVLFCDGLEQAGLVDYARRGRSVADDLLRALHDLDGERSARKALQERCEIQQHLIANVTYARVPRPSPRGEAEANVQPPAHLKSGAANRKRVADLESEGSA